MVDGIEGFCVSGCECDDDSCCCDSCDSCDSCDCCDCCDSCEHLL